MAHEVSVTGDGVALMGSLEVPNGARGVVLFAHGTGSSRYSPRNRKVAATLVAHGFATLLLDLLTPEEEEGERWTRHLRFDIEFLAERLVLAARWLAADPRTRTLQIGYFGASTGAAAALVAAAADPLAIRAVVSRGGRPELAGSSLPSVRAPSLLIVGGADPATLKANREAFALLNCEKRLEVVPAATHLFEEPGALERVADLAVLWFVRNLRRPAERSSAAMHTTQPPRR
jgi:dienelactone hydrolase